MVGSRAIDMMRSGGVWAIDMALLAECDAWLGAGL
jgi:hypothetical protein